MNNIMNKKRACHTKFNIIRVKHEMVIVLVLSQQMVLFWFSPSHGIVLTNLVFHRFTEYPISVLRHRLLL